MRRSGLSAILLGAALFACSPALDWREVRPDGSAAVALFPCKPTSQVRITSLGGARVPMTLVSCQASGQTFALGHADLGDPTRVTNALSEMRAGLTANLAADASRRFDFELAGMTPNAEAMRIHLEGRSPDGSPMQEDAAFFARGARVFQAVVLGRRVDEDAASVFFEGLRLPS